MRLSMLEKPISPRLPKAERVSRELQRRIGSGQLPKGSKLPPIRELAQIFGVSPNTIQLGLNALEKDGLLTKRDRSGIFVSGKQDRIPETLEQEIRPARSRSHRVAEDLASRITQGDFRIGEYLPTRKALIFQFRTSGKTINSALNSLEKKGLIHRIGNAFVVGPPTTKQMRIRDRVYRLSRESRPTDPIIRQNIRPDFLLSFERELATHGISFSGKFDPRGIIAKTAQTLVDRDALGFLQPGYADAWMDKDTKASRRLIDRDIRWISAIRAPTVMFNCGTILDTFPDLSFKPFPAIYPLQIDNRGSGSSIGAYLAMMGHRKIAYFSYSTEMWNHTRGQGLESGFFNATARKGKCLFFKADFQKRRLLRYEPGENRGLEDGFNKMVSSLTNDFTFEGNSPISKMAARLMGLITVNHQFSVMPPLFERALSDPEITAWVCADPNVAVRSARFLHQKGIRVPRNKSLISFDNNEDLSHRGITGFDMQIERLGYLAAHCLLGDIPIKRGKRGEVVCPGKIIDRGSVARV